MSATVIILPVIRIERPGDAPTDLPPIDLPPHRGAGPQQLLPSCDRRNVIELRRVRDRRAQEPWTGEGRS